MAAKPQFDLARDYGAWLRERLVNVDYGEVQSLSTPLLDPFNDGIEIFIEQRGGELVLHDHGRTLANLQDLGVRIEDSERRQALIDRVTASCGVRLVNGRLETHASSASLPQRAHLLLTSIVRLNDLWMSAVPHRWVDFLELVAEFLDERQVLYSRDVSVQGRTVAHEIDFLIPLPKQRERLVKVMGSPSPQTAKVLSFTWMELREARPNAERVVVLNDTRTPDPLEGETVAEARRVSEQVIAILRGYSSDVVRWSERGEPQFRRLWQAA